MICKRSLKSCWKFAWWDFRYAINSNLCFKCGKENARNGFYNGHFWGTVFSTVFRGTVFTALNVNYITFSCNILSWKCWTLHVLLLCWSMNTHMIRQKKNCHSFLCLANMLLSVCGFYTCHKMVNLVVCHFWYYISKDHKLTISRTCPPLRTKLESLNFLNWIILPEKVKLAGIASCHF